MGQPSVPAGVARAGLLGGGASDRQEAGVPVTAPPGRDPALLGLFLLVFKITNVEPNVPSLFPGIFLWG